MKKWKHKILPAILAGTLSVSFAAAANAQGNGNGNGNGHNKGNGNSQKGNSQKISFPQNNFKPGNSYPTAYRFSDLQKHWAEDMVKNMVERSIIKGYPDHTFRPNKPVTQLEALTMVINLLTQNKELLTDGDSYKGYDVPDWAQTTVKLALINDIVDSKDFQPNKPATRLFVIKLLVNALDVDIDDVDEDNLFFGDIANLTDEEREYLSYALLQSLVAGYEDKTFKPNKPVTRAEMAVFVNRLLGKFGSVESGNHVKGTIASIDEDEEELKIGSKTYEIADDVVVKLNGKASSLSKLSKGMIIDAIVKDDEITTIYAYTTSDDEDDVDFKVEKVSDGNDGDDFEEAVKTGSRVSDSTPDLTGETLSIALNGDRAKSIDLDDIDGTQDDGDEVAEALEEAIGDALGDDDRVKVSFENNHFVFETDNSPTDEVPSIKFSGSALNELGLNSTEAKGSLGDSDEETWKITVKSDATTDQTYVIAIEDDNIDEKVEIDVDDNDSAEEIADKIADALQDNDEIDSAYSIDVDGDVVTLTSKTDGEDLDTEIAISKK
ncbi:S-layer homology domain-containing protein [Brevibacillus nitrificans]|uniref:S-layer homology domain-containing protein n=1 Tax=Brevibacillus nitrificans TaxID=651560 RepID=UPI002610EAA1|nr:S-layer homology domain-containing protein [Brevibacillus nitrificans]MED1795842.1 S-layer homology domain-containing protein [Brevibacillus nitrificans]